MVLSAAQSSPSDEGLQTITERKSREDLEQHVGEASVPSMAIEKRGIRKDAEIKKDSDVAETSEVAEKLEVPRN